MSVVSLIHFMLWPIDLILNFFCTFVLGSSVCGSEDKLHRIYVPANNLLCMYTSHVPHFLGSLGESSNRVLFFVFFPFSLTFVLFIHPSVVLPHSLLSSTMSSLDFLAREKIWFDKPCYDEAERRFYERMNGSSQPTKVNAPPHRFSPASSA